MINLSLRAPLTNSMRACHTQQVGKSQKIKAAGKMNQNRLKDHLLPLFWRAWMSSAFFPCLLHYSLRQPLPTICFPLCWFLSLPLWACHFLSLILPSIARLFWQFLSLLFRLPISPQFVSFLRCLPHISKRPLQLLNASSFPSTPRAGSMPPD